MSGERQDRLQAIVDIGSHVNEVMEAWGDEQVSPEMLDSLVRTNLRSITCIVCARAGGMQRLEDRQLSRKYLLDRFDCIVKMLDGAGSAKGASGASALEMISRLVCVDMYDVASACHEDFGFDSELEAAWAKKLNVGRVGDKVGRKGVDGNCADSDAAEIRELRFKVRNYGLVWPLLLIHLVLESIEFGIEGLEVSFKLRQASATKKIADDLRCLTERLGELENGLYVGNDHGE